MADFTTDSNGTSVGRLIKSFEDYLLMSGTIDAQFIQEFRTCFRDRKGFCVSLEKAMSWIGYSDKITVQKILKSQFTKGEDYKQEIGNITMLTVDCFKRLAQLAPTDKGKKVRKYFTEIELAQVSYVDYATNVFENKISNLQTENEKVKQENESIKKKVVKHEYKRTDYIYVFEDKENGFSEVCEPYYKIEYAVNITTHKKEGYLFAISCIDQFIVRNMLRTICKGYAIPNKDIYGIKLESLKVILEKCSDFMETMWKWNVNSLYSLMSFDLPELNIDKILLNDINGIFTNNN
jgi:hypothetical protein